LHKETFGHDKTWKPFREIPFRGKPEWSLLPGKKKEKTNEPLGDVNQISLF
jgi:hypothetical protein